MAVRLLSVFMLVLQVLGVILLAVPAFADRAIGQGKAPEYWSMATSVTRTNSLYKSDAGDETASWDFSVAPSIILNRDYTLSALIETSQDIKGEEYDYGGGRLGLTKSSGFYGFNKRVTFIPSGSIGFPLSKSSQASSYQFGTTLTGRMVVNRDYLVTKKLGLSMSVSATRNFHQYETAINGKVNTKYQSVQSGTVSWDFTDWMSLSVTGSHIDTVSYQGASRDYLSHNEELGFQMNPRWSFAVGHSWGNPYVSTRRANGQDINFELQDEQNSLIYAQLGFLL